MKVTNITVRFERKRQPAQYETSGGFVEFSAAIEEGSTENHIEVARSLLGDAKTLILTELGIVAPGTSASAPVVAATAAAVEGGKKAKAKKDAPAETRQISTGDERVDPAQSDIPDGSAGTPAPAQASSSVDIPGESAPAQKAATAAAPTGPTAEELTAYVSKLVKEGKLDSPTVKGISRKFGAEKIAQIDPGKLGAYKTEIDDAVKKFSAASDL